MSADFNDKALELKLNGLAMKLKHTTPLMRDIERALVSETLLNFQSQGRPKWAGLAPSTIARYSRQGKSVNMILQQKGFLKGSVQGSHDATSATVGAGSGPSSAYAAIQQWGGLAGRGLKSKIPSRKYIPIDEKGYLQPEAEETVHDVVDVWWKR
jgi:phage virion morphogenesis protein